MNTATGSDYTVTVTELARFCHRSGDIDHRFTPSPSGAEGTAGHQRLYRQRPDSYQTEYAVNHRQEVAGIHLLLRGRADGYDPAQGVVEEIKTCRVAPDSIPEAVAALHLAQGRLYAAIIARQEKLSALDVQVTWLNIDSDEQFSRSHHYSRGELEAFLQHSLEQFGSWLQRVSGRRAARDASLTGLPFPLGEFRAGQREIAELTYKCADQGGQLLIEAPTGIGKTAAVIYPALKAMARDKHDKIVFVTARTVGRIAAQDTLRQFRAAGFGGNSLSLTAKDTICLSPGRACHGDDCPYARGYYDKLPGAMIEAIKQPALTREDLEALARQFEVCPYELAGDLVPWMDLVIADIHYLYSLAGSLGHTLDEAGARWSVLLDEAHNLPDRARGMYGATLSKAQLMQVKKLSTGAVGKALAAINRQMLALDKLDWRETDYHCDEALPTALINSLHGLIQRVGEELASDATCLQRQPELMDFYFGVLQFLRVSEHWGDEFRLRLHRGKGRQGLRVELACLDPARLLGQRHARAHSITAFSATLSPLAWSRRSLGLADDTVAHRATSPFAREQLEVILATDISTRYRDREHSLPALAGRLRDWLQEPGNCIIYFPSYIYLEQALALVGDLAGRTRWVQRPDMDETARQELLDLFQARRDVAAFCILGGIFGEGIDLPGEQLSSVAVVGVGMPQVNRQTRELQTWYDQTLGNGFEYAFIYPGMQKVDQALGRVVRTEQDRGRALLIDSRYGEQTYRPLLPPWWDYRQG